MLPLVTALKAHVKIGQIVLDEPTEPTNGMPGGELTRAVTLARTPAHAPSA